MWLGVPSGSLLESVAAELFVRPHDSLSIENHFDGEGPLFVRMSVEAINRFHDSTTPEEKPKWDLVSRTLTFKKRDSITA